MNLKNYTSYFHDGAIFVSAHKVEVKSPKRGPFTSFYGHLGTGGLPLAERLKITSANLGILNNPLILSSR